MEIGVAHTHLPEHVRLNAIMLDDDPDDVLLELAEHLRRALCAGCAGLENGPSPAETREMLDAALVQARAVIARRPGTGEWPWPVRSSSS